MRRLLRGIVMVLLLRRPEPPPPVEEGGPEEGRPFHREVGARPRAEALVVALLLGSALASVAFVVVLFSGANTQALGVALALALGLFGAALAVSANALVPRERAVEARPGLAHPAAQPPVEERLRSTREGVSRRRLLGAAGAAAGTTLAAAVAAPITSLGPPGGDSIVETPWRPGRRVVGGGRPPPPGQGAPSPPVLTPSPP